MNRHLSISRRIYNLKAAQDIQNTLSKHIWYHARGQSKEDFGTNWSERKDISWTQDWGRVRTRESFWYAKVTGYDMMPYQAYVKVYKVWPEIGGLDPRPLFGAAMHAVDTDIIEVADDGETARGVWFSPGVIHAPLQPDKRPIRLTDHERYGADFIYEHGQWLFLNNKVCPDVMIPGDHINWASEAYKMLTNKKGNEIKCDTPVPEALPYPADDVGPFHRPYSITQAPQDSVPWPKPYRTLDKENSYYWSEGNDGESSCVPEWVKKNLKNME